MMPTYIYECEACHHQHEQFHAMSARPRNKCPKCGKRRLRRIISSGGGLLFRGSGFHETDYRSANYKRDKKREEKK
jgi:putative FmdB family regulatory protein